MRFMGGIALCAILSSGASAQAITEHYCKSVEHHVVVDARAQKVLTMGVGRGRFDSVDYNKNGKFCVFEIENGDKQDSYMFAVTPAKAAVGGRPRFRFQHMD